MGWERRGKRKRKGIEELGKVEAIAAVESEDGR